MNNKKLLLLGYKTNGRYYLNQKDKKINTIDYHQSAEMLDGRIYRLAYRKKSNQLNLNLRRLINN